MRRLGVSGSAGAGLHVPAPFDKISCKSALGADWDRREKDRQRRIRRPQPARDRSPLSHPAIGFDLRCITFNCSIMAHNFVTTVPLEYGLIVVCR